MRLALFVLAVALAVPTAARAQLDHLKCYKIKDHLAKVPPYSATLTPGNPSFTVETGCVVKVPAKMLCIDVTKSNVTPAPPGAAPGPQAGTFLCYKLKCQGATPSLTLTDQFGTRQVDVGVAKLLCAPVTGPPTTTTSTTLPTCGNGVVGAGEQCDDGGTMGGDGCSATCQVEDGWQCTGQPSTCSTICGDGIIAGTEQCDDGNTISGDGCSATCQLECGQLGASCAVTADCCQNLMTLHCSGGICTCGSVGAPCVANGDCCMNHCAAGSCMP